MMGLAAYGEPVFLPQVRDVVQTLEGQCRLNLDYFRITATAYRMTWDQGNRLSGTALLREIVRSFWSLARPRSEILVQSCSTWRVRCRPF